MPTTPSTGPSGSTTITLFTDNALTITAEVPSKFSLARNGDWEGDQMTVLHLANRTNFTVTVTSITLNLRVCEPHNPGDQSTYANSRNFRVKWDAADIPQITIAPPGGIVLSGQQTVDHDADKWQWFVNNGVNGANGDGFLKAVVSYTVSGGVTNQPGPDTVSGNADAIGVRGPWVTL